MIYTDGSEVMVDGVLLPGLFKSLEVTTAAEIEEQEVEGSTAKPKQATGYEDAKISVELILLDDADGMTKERKLEVIQNVFRQPGQEIPAVHTIVNEHTVRRNISQVLFKQMVSKTTNANDQLSVTMEFWEYIPMTISVTSAKKAGETNYAADGAGSGSGNLNKDYEKYLENRGQAPKQKDKTVKTPAKDNRRPYVK